MKITIVSRKLIKPCTPTPQNLKNYKISFKDELISPMNVGIILFYRSRPKSISYLEESLSKTLVQFYPLAGRYIKKDHIVDCSNQGAEFVAAVVADDVEPTDVLNSGRLDELLPRRCDLVDGMNDPLLSIQITELIECEGFAVGITVSHRIFDGSSLGTFIAAWSNANMNQRGKFTIVPSFESLLLFPGKNLNHHTNLEPSRAANIVAKRFLFKKEAIITLKSLLKPKDGAHNALSRVRVVSAVIAEALIRLDRAKHRRSRPCLMVQSVNMRHRTIPPLPKHSCGNLVLHAATESIQSANNLRIQELSYTLTHAIEKTVSECAEIFSLGEDRRDEFIIDRESDLIVRSKSRDVVNCLQFSDWSKFGFYVADFGWGKPVAVGVATLPLEKLTVLVNNSDGCGIEAWVHLSTNDMPYFEEDERVKIFTG